MRTLLEAGARVQQVFERHGWKFCFIGGVANFRWGTPRLTTLDADGNPASLNPQYKQPLAYQAPMAARVGVEVTF